MESAAINFAKHELSLLRAPGDEPDEMQDAIEENIIRILEVFAEAGHSGFSASYATNILNKLLRFEPLTPLTGADDE